MSRAPTKASEPLLIRFPMKLNCHCGSRSLGGQADTRTDTKKIPNRTSESASKIAAKSVLMILAAGLSGAKAGVAIFRKRVVAKTI